ncbi:MAG: DUF1254 domain-containing protein [Rhizomicrobium sp.]
MVVWETLMDAETVLLTANTETVYALGHLHLQDDGPTVVEAPPRMLGLAMDALQRYLVDIGPLRSRQGTRRQIPVPAAGLRRSGAGRLPRGPLADLQRRVRHARLPGRRQEPTRRLR